MFSSQFCWYIYNMSASNGLKISSYLILDWVTGGKLYYNNYCSSLLDLSSPAVWKIIGILHQFLISINWEIQMYTNWGDLELHIISIFWLNQRSHETFNSSIENVLNQWSVKRASFQFFETSVTNNSSFQDFNCNPESRKLFYFVKMTK